MDGQLGTEIDSPTVFNPLSLSFFAKKKVISVSAGLSHCGSVVCTCLFFKFFSFFFFLTATVALVNPGGDTEVYTWGSGEKGKLGNNSERVFIFFFYCF